MKNILIPMIILFSSFAAGISAQTETGPVPPRVPEFPSLPVPPESPTLPDSNDNDQPGTSQSDNESRSDNANESVPPSEDSASPRFYRISQVLSLALLARQGRNNFEEAGEIVDVIIDPDGTVMYYIVDLKKIEGYRSGIYRVGADRIRLLDDAAELDLSTLEEPITYIRDKKLMRQYYDDSSVQTSRLLEYKVFGNDSREIGTFTDIVINVRDNTVSYIVLVDSGFLGFNTVYHAVPYDVVTLNNTSESAVLPIPENRLSRFSGFDNEYWPTAHDPEWDEYRNRQGEESP